MSMIGLACRFGTAVLPMCSRQLIKDDKQAHSDRCSAWYMTGLFLSYGTTSILGSASSFAFMLLRHYPRISTAELPRKKSGTTGFIACFIFKGLTKRPWLQRLRLRRLAQLSHALE